MPYKYVEPEVAVSISEHGCVYHAYKGDNIKMGYWFAWTKEDAEEGGEWFDVRKTEEFRIASDDPDFSRTQEEAIYVALALILVRGTDQATERKTLAK